MEISEHFRDVVSRWLLDFRVRGGAKTDLNVSW